MKILDLEQGSIPWMVSRLGIPTASRFDDLLTPVTRKPSKSQDRYRAELLSEWLLGQPTDWGTSAWMERGTELEDEARRWYEMDQGVDVERVGLVLRDDGLTGGSPDGLVGLDGGLEIKCPAAVQHVKYLLNIERISDSHIGQVQGYMYLTGRKWWDMLSYNPALPAVVERVAVDDAYQAALVAVLDPFIEQVESDKRKWAEYRVPRPWDPDQLAAMEAQR